MGLKDQLEKALIKKGSQSEFDELTKASQGQAAKRNQLRFDGGPFSDVPPPVKAQNKVAKNDFIGMKGGDANSGVPIRFDDDGNAIESSMVKEGRKQNVYEQRIKNPEKAITVGGRSGQAISRLARPMGRLPGALGMLDVAHTARAMKEFNKKPWPQALGIDTMEDL